MGLERFCTIYVILQCIGTVDISNVLDKRTRKFIKRFESDLPNPANWFCSPLVGHLFLIVNCHFHYVVDHYTLWYSISADHLHNYIRTILSNVFYFAYYSWLFLILYCDLGTSLKTLEHCFYCIFVNLQPYHDGPQSPCCRRIVFGIVLIVIVVPYLNWTSFNNDEPLIIYMRKDLKWLQLKSRAFHCVLYGFRVCIRAGI